MINIELGFEHLMSLLFAAVLIVGSLLAKIYSNKVKSKDESSKEWKDKEDAIKKRNAQQNATDPDGLAKRIGTHYRKIWERLNPPQ